MKTPMQEFIDEVSKCRNEMLEFASKMDKREGYFEGMIKAFGDVESILKFRYLEKEKEVMKKMFIEGDGSDYYLGIEDESFEYLYNTTFTK